MRLYRAVGAGCSIVLALAAPLLRAQEGVPGGAAGAKVVPPPAASAGPVLVAPKLKTKVDPVYPKEKLEKGEKAEVKVELSLDDTGKVIGAKVITSAGPEFDASALEAATKLEFEPATKDGKAIPAKIPYRFTFDFQDVPAVTPPPGTIAPPKKPAVNFAGEVKTPVEDALPGAVVTVYATDGTSKSTITDTKGSFAFTDLPLGKYKVRIVSEGFQPFESDEEITKGTVTRAIYRPRVASDAIEIEVKGDRPPREVTKHSLDARELSRIPGTNGDALRAIQSLPGVARPPGFAGLLIIRGSSPMDTNVFIDGTLVPIVYHFFGLSSVVPTEMLEKIDFYPGNFGPEYGRVMGGIVDVGIRSPKKDGYHGLLQFDFIDGRFLLEGPIDKKTRFAVAGRRSWIDVLIKPVLKEAGVGVSTAPVYYDYQVMVERDVTEKTTARLLFFGSNDRLAITLNTPAASDPTVGGDIGLMTGFWRLQGRADTKFNADVRWTNTLAYGSDYASFNLGDLSFRLDTHPLSWRSDVRAKISNEAFAIVGLDFLWASFDVYVKAPPFPIPGEAPGPFFGRPPRELTGAGALFRPAMYAMLDLAPITGLKLLPGIRMDYTKDTATWTASPRFAVRYDLVPGPLKTVLKAGFGIFLQPPQPNESIEPFGTKGLGNNRAVHYSAGFEQGITKQVTLKMEGFFKDLTNLVSRVASENSTANGITYANGGSGRVYGAELLLRYEPDEIFFGWVAYTLSKSERRLAPGQPLTNFIFDQTHILTLIGSFRLGRGWEAGARFRYVSGSMFTPNIGGVLDFDAGAYAPIPSQPPYGERNPPFHQLDIRIDKKWKFTSWQLMAYLDVMNVYYRQNPEGVSYNYNYSQRQVITGLPILPVLGLRGDM